MVAILVTWSINSGLLVVSCIIYRRWANSDLKYINNYLICIHSCINNLNDINLAKITRIAKIQSIEFMSEANRFFKWVDT